MKYYPVFLNLKNRLCIVIGGGKVAERKIKMLLEAGAKIKVISPELTKDLTKLADEKKIIWEKREYKKGDLEGAWLVITATNNKKVQIEVQQEAEEKRIFCNIVDVPELCSFIVPSVIKRGLLTIAISTSSASPAVSRRIRENLENLFGEEYVIYMNLMKNLREQILNNQNLSSQEKNEKLQRLAMAPIPKYIKYKDFNLLKTIIEKEGLTFPSDILDLLNTNIFSRES